MNSEQYIEMFELNLAYSRKNLLWRVCCWNNYIYGNLLLCVHRSITRSPAVCVNAAAIIYTVDSINHKRNCSDEDQKDKFEIDIDPYYIMFKYIRTLNQL